MKKEQITWTILLAISVFVATSEYLFFYMLNGVWHHGEKEFWILYTYASLALLLILKAKPQTNEIIAILVSPLLANILLKCETLLILSFSSHTLVTSTLLMAIAGLFWVALYFYFFYQYHKYPKHLVFAYIVMLVSLLPIAHNGAQDISRHDRKLKGSKPVTYEELSTLGRRHAAPLMSHSL